MDGSYLILTVLSDIFLSSVLGSVGCKSAPEKNKPSNNVEPVEPVAVTDSTDSTDIIEDKQEDEVTGTEHCLIKKRYALECPLKKVEIKGEESSVPNEISVGKKESAGALSIKTIILIENSLY